MGLHVREGVKGMIFILNPKFTRVNFWESWSFNKKVTKRKNKVVKRFKPNYIAFMLEVNG